MVSAVVLSDVYGWHERGVTVVGHVSIDAGDLFQLPLAGGTLKYLKQTTSTAMYVICAIWQRYTLALLPSTLD